MATTVPIAPWEFLDYVESVGTNQISVWLSSISLEARNELEALLDTIRPFQALGRPQTGKLSGECDGLFEFIFKNANVQYRPLFVYGPRARQITILAGATKTGGRSRKTPTKWDPPNVCDTAKRRQRNLDRDLARRVPHVRVR